MLPKRLLLMEDDGIRLPPLTKKELVTKAEKLGISREDVLDALMEEDTRQALIKLIMARDQKYPHMKKMTLTQLKNLGRDLAFDEQNIKDVDLNDDPKEAIIQLILACRGSAGNLRNTQLILAREATRLQLKTMTLTQLKTLWRNLRLSEQSKQSMEYVDDNDDPEEAIIQLILAMTFLYSDTQWILAKEATKLRLKTMSLTELKNLGRNLGYGEQSIEYVDDNDDPNVAITELALAKLNAMTLRDLKSWERNLSFSEQTLENVDDNRHSKEAVIQMILAKQAIACIVVHDGLLVTSSKDGKSAEVAQLAKGTRVTLLGVAAEAYEGRVCARLASPSGWVSTRMADGPFEFVQEITTMPSLPQASLSLTDPIGFWEYEDDDGKFVPYTRDESLQLDIACDRRASELIMALGRSTVQVKFVAKAKEGSIRRGRLTLATGKTRNIHRELSARELVHKARGVMEQCMCEHTGVRGSKYTEPHSVLEILGRESTPVKLIRRTWVTTYAECQAIGLPRRQKLEQTEAAEAFLPLAQVTHTSCFNIFSISYCWRERNHPDADGKQLRVIATELKMQASTYAESDVRAVRDDGIFWDFCSLHQKNDDGIRTEEEHAKFKEALISMDIWYMHAMIMAIIANGKWSRELGVNYEGRGWTQFERSCAGLVKPTTAGGLYLGRPMITEFSDSGRKLPLSPELFAEGLAQKRFTSKGDKEHVVELYTKATMLALQTAETMSLTGIKVQRNDGKQIASVLQHCCSAVSLALDSMGITDHELHHISAALPRMQKLRVVCLNCNEIGNDGPQAIATALSNVPLLRTLFIQHNRLGNAGARALAERLPRMQNLEILFIDCNGIGDAGAHAIAEAMGKMSKLRFVRIFDNEFTENGETALHQAWVNAGKDECSLWLHGSYKEKQDRQVYGIGYDL